MSDAVILSGVRTPIGSFGGSLAGVSAVGLGATVIAESLRRADVAPEAVDEVLMGNILSGGLGQGPARQAALTAGLPETVSATSVNQLCASGLRAVALAAQAIRAGDAEVLVAGGMESMSQAPHVLRGARDGMRLGDAKLEDTLLLDGLVCGITGVHMGDTAENLAVELEVTREDQDALAVESQRRAAEAIAAGRFREEIVGVEAPARRGATTLVEDDEHPRADATLERLSGLKPAFRKGGTVTAGNSSGINDGAAAFVVTSREWAEQSGHAPRAVIRGYATTGVDPRVMGIGPVEAVPKALAHAGLQLTDIDLIEVNEAFAAQSLAVMRLLHLDDQRVNVNGGAIALGHPVGASGARVLVTLLHEMERRDVRLGLAALCVGGGQGIAMVIEREAA